MGEIAAPRRASARSASAALADFDGRRLGIERHLLVQRAHDQVQPLQRIASTPAIALAREFAQRAVGLRERRWRADTSRGGSVSTAPRTTPTASVVSTSPMAETVKRSTGL